MPGTPEEMVTLVNAIIVGSSTIDAVDCHIWADGDAITDSDRVDVLALYRYALSIRDPPDRTPQRRAMRLLRTMLDREQLRDLRICGSFRATGISGQVYRLWPRTGLTQRIERHGSRWFGRANFCLHDEKDDEKMPPADVVLAHLLLIMSDEESFLGTANLHPRDDQLWNGEYLRRIRRRRLECAQSL